MTKHLRVNPEATPPNPDEKLLTTAEAADYFGMSVRTLEKWRKDAVGPAFVELGARDRKVIRYRMRDLKTYAEGHTVATIHGRGPRLATER